VEARESGSKEIPLSVGNLINRRAGWEKGKEERKKKVAVKKKRTGISGIGDHTEREKMGMIGLNLIKTAIRPGGAEGNGRTYL